LRAAGAGLAENERVVTIGGLDALRDRLYVLETAIEDIERDLADGDAGLAVYREALECVLAAARPLVAYRPLGDRCSSCTCARRRARESDRGRRFAWVRPADRRQDLWMGWRRDAFPGCGFSLG
jgi:hypothetical protein